MLIIVKVEEGKREARTVSCLTPKNRLSAKQETEQNSTVDSCMTMRPVLDVGGWFSRLKTARYCNRGQVSDLAKKRKEKKEFGRGPWRALGKGGKEAWRRDE
jgi:hypothetical protein